MFGSLNPAQWKVVTASTLVKTGQGNMTGLLCASSASLIIRVRDGLTVAGAIVVDQITLVAGTPYPIPAKFNNGIFIEVVSGAGSVTAFYD